jgi:hypothetical protein
MAVLLMTVVRLKRAPSPSAVLQPGIASVWWWAHCSCIGRKRKAGERGRPLFGQAMPLFGLERPTFGLESPLFGLEASMFDRQTPLLAWRDLLKQS